MNILVFKGRLKKADGQHGAFLMNDIGLSERFRAILKKFNGTNTTNYRQDNGDLNFKYYDDLFSGLVPEYPHYPNKSCLTNNVRVQFDMGDGKKIEIDAGSNWFLTFDKKFGTLLRAEGPAVAIVGLTEKEIAEKFSMGPEHMNLPVSTNVTNVEPMENLSTLFPEGTEFKITDRYYCEVRGKICVDLYKFPPSGTDITKVVLSSMRLEPVRDEELEKEVDEIFGEKPDYRL